MQALGSDLLLGRPVRPRAIVFIPYNVSIMALFEQYTACMPIYVPIARS